MSLLQKKTKTKQAERQSIECKDCLYNDTCDFKYGLSIFEKNHNVEVDCWKKKVYSNIFCTGLHKSLFVEFEGLNQGEKMVQYTWLHALSEKFDIEAEDYLNN